MRSRVTGKLPTCHHMNQTPLLPPLASRPAALWTEAEARNYRCHGVSRRKGELSNANALARPLVAAVKARATAAPMRALVIIACVVCAIAALGLAFMTLMDVSMNGFPDGHITDYERATDAPLTILAWVEAGFGLPFLALAFSPIGTRARG